MCRETPGNEIYILLRYAPPAAQKHNDMKSANPHICKQCLNLGSSMTVNHQQYLDNQ